MPREKKSMKDVVNAYITSYENQRITFGKWMWGKPRSFRYGNLCSLRDRKRNISTLDVWVALTYNHEKREFDGVLDTGGNSKKHQNSERLRISFIHDQCLNFPAKKKTYSTQFYNSIIETISCFEFLGERPIEEDVNLEEFNAYFDLLRQVDEAVGGSCFRSNRQNEKMTENAKHLKSIVNDFLRIEGGKSIITNLSLLTQYISLHPRDETVLSDLSSRLSNYSPGDGKKVQRFLTRRRECILGQQSEETRQRSVQSAREKGSPGVRWKTKEGALAGHEEVKKESEETHHRHLEEKQRSYRDAARDRAAERSGVKKEDERQAADSDKKNMYHIAVEVGPIKEETEEEIRLEEDDSEGPVEN